MRHSEAGNIKKFDSGMPFGVYSHTLFVMDQLKQPGKWEFARKLEK